MREENQDRLLAIYLPLGGLFIASIFLAGIRHAILRDRLSVDSLIVVIIGIPLILMTIPMILFPFHKKEWYSNLVPFFFYPFIGVAWILRSLSFLFSPILAILSISIVPLLAWSIIISQSALAKSYSQFLLYLILLLSSLIFAYRGDFFLKLGIRFWQTEKFDYSFLSNLIKPSMLRVYTYAIMAIAYTLSNIELFAEASLIPGSLWDSYKGVVLEVLLSFVAIDAVIIAWKDHKELETNSP